MALVFFDDIVIFCQAARRHINYERPVFRLSNETGVTLQLKKGAFSKMKIYYSGQVISSDQLEVLNHTTDTMEPLKIPKTQTELRSFLSLCNLLPRLVRYFARITSFLTARQRNEIAKELRKVNEQELSFFGILQEKLMYPPTMALPRKNGGTPWTKMHVIAKYGMYCYRGKTMRSIVQLDIDQRPCTTEKGI